MIHQMKATSVSSQHLRHMADSNEINKPVTEEQYCRSCHEARNNSLSSQPAVLEMGEANVFIFHPLWVYSNNTSQLSC